MHCTIFLAGNPKRAFDVIAQPKNLISHTRLKTLIQEHTIHRDRATQNLYEVPIDAARHAFGDKLSATTIMHSSLKELETAGNGGIILTPPAGLK